MKKIAFAIGASIAAVALPAAAQAQAYAGVSAGYHDLGIADDVEDLFDDSDFDVQIDDGSPIIGGFVGYDFPVGTGAFAGIEANLHLGTDAIDTEYGASARFGFADAGGAKYYLRGGYQEVSLDYAEMITVDGITFDDSEFDGLDDTFGDFLVGAGVDFPMGTGTLLRVNVDTVGFDTVRATAGFGFRF